MPASPRADHRKDRHQLDRPLGEAVDGLLAMAGVVLSGYQPEGDEAFEPRSEYVRGDPLLGMRQKIAKMPAVAEHDVADDDEAPPVAQHLHRQIDRAARPSFNIQRALLEKTDRSEERRVGKECGRTGRSRWAP